MKKILIALIAVLIITATNAQKGFTTTTKNGSITAADTTNMLNVEGGIVNFEYNLTKTNGTAAGKVYLQGRFLSTNWVNIDSITINNVTTEQTLRHFPTKVYYASYRWVNTNTSSATMTVVSGYYRRPGTGTQ